MKNPGGQPTKYKPEYDDQARFVVETSGFSILKLAKLFSCDRSTIYNWMGAHPGFFDAIKSGRKVFEGLKIERSLVKRATGYPYTETYREIDPDDSNKMIIVKKVRKQMAPDVAAIKHWQSNMDPDNWRDRKTIDGSLTLSQAIEELESDGRPKPE